MDKVDEAMRVRCNLSIILSPSYAKTEINDQKLVLFQIKVIFLFLSQLWFLALQLVAMITEGSLIRVELISWFLVVRLMLERRICWQSVYVGCGRGMAGTLLICHGVHWDSELWLRAPVWRARAGINQGE